MGVSYAGVALDTPSPAFAAELEARFSVDDVIRTVTGAEFARELWPMNRTPWLTFPGSLPRRSVRLNALHWPKGASRFAIAHLVASDAQLALIRQAGAPLAAQSLVMSWEDAVAKTVVASVSPSMWMLPPLPLHKIAAGGRDKHLLTLVDQRFWWYFKPTGALTVDGFSVSWDDLYQQLAANTGLAITWDAIDPAYLLPSSLFTTNYEYLPLLLDAIAYNVGQRIVVGLDGSVRGRSVLAGAADVAANLALSSARSVLAGGAFLPSDVLASIPANVLVSFPYLADNAVQPTPFTATAPTGGTASAVKVFHDTAAYDGSNANLLQALTTRIALDYGAASLQVGDWKYAGIVPWKPEPIHDAVEWVVTGEGGPGGDGEVSTRIYPAPWNDLTDQLLHGSEAGSTPVGCCEAADDDTDVDQPPFIVVNDTYLTQDFSDYTQNSFVFNLADNTLNLLVCPGNNQPCRWVTFCPCDTTSGSVALSGSGGIVLSCPGVCNLCTHVGPLALQTAPGYWTIDVAGFTGALAVLNGRWQLANTRNCVWSQTRTVGGVKFYASLIVSSHNVVLGFLDLTNNIQLAVYESGAGPPTGDCCSKPTILRLVSFDQGDDSGGGTNGACTACLTNRTPLQWSLDLSGLTGDFVVFNGTWAVPWTGGAGGCGWEWVVRDPSGNILGHIIITAFGSGAAAWLGIDLNTGTGSILTYYQNPGDMADCCQPQSLLLDSGHILGNGSGPATILATPDCESGGNGAPDQLQANPFCCPKGDAHDSGSGGSGGSVSTDCCPGIPVAATLYATFTGSLAAIGRVPLTWTGTNWSSLSPLQACDPDNHTGIINFSCATNGGNLQFDLAASFWLFFNISGTATTCSPFLWVNSGNNAGAGPGSACPNGPFGVTIKDS